MGACESESGQRAPTEEEGRTQSAVVLIAEKRAKVTKIPPSAAPPANLTAWRFSGEGNTHPVMIAQKGIIALFPYCVIALSSLFLTRPIPLFELFLLSLTAFGYPNLLGACVFAGSVPL